MRPPGGNRVHFALVFGGLATEYSAGDRKGRPYAEDMKSLLQIWTFDATIIMTNYVNTKEEK